MSASHPFTFRVRLSVLLALVFLVSACNHKLGPDFVQPEIPTAQSWLYGSPDTSQKNLAKSWWTLFEDPTLNHLIERAYQQNLDVQAAALKIFEARARLGIARSYLLPQHAEMRVDGLYEQLSQQSPYEQDLQDYNFPYFQSGFDTAWEIDIWGKFRRGIESSAAKLAAQTLDYDDILVTLTADVASAYTQIRTFQQRLALAKGNADLQDRTFRIAQSQFLNGLNTELDMQQANALKQKTLAEITHLETGLRQSRNALCFLLGMQPNLLIQVLGDSTEIPSIRKPLAFGVPAEVLKRRPDVRREAFHAAEESAHIGMALSELFPSLTLIGSVSFATGSIDAVDAMNAISPSGLAGKFGPTIRWPILQFGRLRNNVRAQDAKFQAALVRYRNTVLRALREVEDGLVEYQQSELRVTHLTQGVNASKRSADLALLQYQNGLEDYTRVLNSELFLVDQQDRLTASRGEIANSLIAVYKALGGGWEIRNGRTLLAKDTRDTMQQRTDWGEMLEESPESLFKNQSDPSHPDASPKFEGIW